MHSVDVYRIINGIYKTDTLYDVVEITELNNWLRAQDVHFVNDSILADNHTGAPKYFIK